ncbi:site-specific integrase, partial [Latilactobacillus curvatus]|uniref:site-specific integrase n=1 Tax=Latilactobacillus curvatus TaxID=28038 RepID=UPI002074838E
IGGLTWDNVDFEKKEIYVKNIYDYQDTKKIVPRTKTPSSVRTIPLLPELSIILKQLKKEQAEWQLKNKYRDPENAVFKSSECKIPTDTGCIKTLILIQDEINIPRKQQIATHGLRHTLASYLLAKGVQIKYVSELLGHKNTAITMRAYEHLLKEQNIEQQGKTLNALNELSK